MTAKAEGHIRAICQSEVMALYGFRKASGVVRRWMKSNGFIPQLSLLNLLLDVAIA